MAPGLALRALRGGSATAKSAGTLGEKQLERLFGKQYTLDLTVPHNKATLIKLIKDHRLGGGEFNVVTLDGKEYRIPGTKGDSEAGASSHFNDLGQGAGKSAKGEKKDAPGDKVNAAKRALAAAADYRGVTYTEAELRKLPKAEAEYRRELMARSKQEVKMEMGFESGLKAGLDIYKSVMQKFGGDDKDSPPSAADWEQQLPKRGVVQFRFKAKELKVTGSAGQVPLEKAAWAVQRSAAMSRARGVADEARATEKKNASFTDRVNEVISIRFVVKKAFEAGMALASVAVSVAAWAWDTLRGLLGSSSSPSTASLRAARSAAIS